MKTSKFNKWITWLLVALFSCCLIGVTVSLASSSEETYSGAKFAPEITVNFGEFDENNIPDAVINKPYKIFSATAEDLYSKELYVSVRVWMYYDSVTRSLINVNNGTITPTGYGVYTVEYKAIDRWNNVTTYLYDFECREKEDLTANVGSDATVYKTGESISVNVPEFLNNVGTVDYTVIAVLNGANVEYPVIDGKFTPLYSGEYDVIYNYSDYNETSESSYSLTVNANEQLVWKNVPVISEYMFAGKDYVIDSAYAYSFVGGTPTENLATITVTDPDNQPVSLSAGNVFNGEKSGIYKFKYSVNVSGASIENTVTSTCVDVGGFDGTDMDMSKYFVGENIESVISPNGARITTSTDGAIVKFINPINAKVSHVEFAVDADSANSLESVDIILTDAYDSSNSLVFNFSKDGKAGKFGPLGGKTVKTEIGFNGKVFVFEYDNEFKTAYLADTEVVSIKKNANGTEFTGFKGDSVLVSLRFNGVNSASTIIVNRVANQVIYNEIGDGVSPDVQFDRWTGGEVQVGDIVTLGRVYVKDALSPLDSVTYFVMAPDGTYVTDVNGLVLSPENADYSESYQFEINQDGRYIVSVKAIDFFGNETVYDYPVVSVSVGMVHITLNNDGDKTAKVGDKVDISSFTVDGDNVDELSIRIFYVTPDLVVMSDIEDDEFEVKMAGEYQVWYYVSDSGDNMDMVCYTIKVS